MKDLDRFKTELKLGWLKEFYPSLAIYLMNRSGMKDELRDYMECCKKLVDGEQVKDYSRYIHGWLIPYF